MFADHIDPKVAEGNPEMVPNRNGFGEGLRAVGEENQSVVALSADLTGSTRTNYFSDDFPERFVQVGVAEQNMASVASGMAAMGKIPFIASYAMFSPGRSWEQIRTTIAYNDSNVKIIGAHAGVSVGPDGATHQALEDIAITRVMPNMVVIAPADVHEAKKAIVAAAEYNGPVYIRVAREKTPVVTTEASPFAIGKAERVFSRDEAHEKTVGVVATGTLLYEALQAAQQLAEAGIGASVLHMPTIKPLDTETLEAFAAEHGALVTVEEHQVTGGLGGAVAEHLIEVQPVKVGRIGVQDRFGQSGTADELMEEYGLSAAAIVEKAKAVVG